ncbi:Gfo/Idh/MocA family protein [Paenibacillus dakarensis]|uniref:Gfo/Idh/MocA family protein n=1 Tax=Paenibacillus dakarensis TaxID=1527293 RepID=UPI0006D5698B|nr:hypothetical protein [Paenibacillus dakarensis]
MKKIGFIDYYLDEWHANKYPEWIRSTSGGRMQVTCAYGAKNADHGLTNAEWCLQNNIKLLDTIEEVVNESDYLVILSPDHPEQHEALAQLPLRSGKPTYIDKTFAPDREAAIRLFELAEQHGTPLYSSSALRFATEYIQMEREGIQVISSWGPGAFENYSIHQIEPIISMMGSEPKRVMYIGTTSVPALLIEFDDGRQATIHHLGADCPFTMAVNYHSGSCRITKPESDFFNLFIQDLITFFDTGRISVSSSQTISIITIIEYGMKAASRPYEWVELPQNS